MSLALTILGSSSATPTANRNPSAQVLEIFNRLFLIDCGEGCQMQMRKYKVKMSKINHVFISHLHGDHVFGLPGFLSSLHLMNRTHPLHVYCHEPLKEILELQFKYSQTYLNFEIVYHFHQESGESVIYEDEKVLVESIQLKHRIPCTGFIFRQKPSLLSIRKDMIESLQIQPHEIPALKRGADYTDRQGKVFPNNMITFPPKQPQSYAYCSDTIYDPGLVPKLKGVSLLYHESTFTDEMSVRAADTYHTTASQAATIAAEAGVDQLLLGHFSARYRQLDVFKDEASRIFKNVFLAHEGNIFTR